MSYRIKIFLVFVFGILLIVSTESSSQCKSKKDSTKHVMKKVDCCQSKSTSAHASKTKEEANTKIDISKNIEAIDKDKDGKVYIDGMCTDVIKDEPGNCPNCGMKLKEVTIKQAIDFIKNN